MQGLEYLPAIISAIGTIIAAWFSYNQYTKNKQTDLNIEKFKEEQKEKQRSNNYASATIIGQLWRMMTKLNADRVYIVQPHPLGNESMLTVFYEADGNGVKEMRPRIQNMKMSNVPRFCEDLAKNLFMYITDIDEQVDDRYAKSMFMTSGCHSVIIKRLNDNRYDWVGSIFCEFMEPMNVSEEEAREVMHEAAINIQYLLPEISENH